MEPALAVLTWTVRLAALAVVLGVPLRAWRLRGRAYAVFGFVVLAVSVPGAVAMHGRLTGGLSAPLRLGLELAFLYSIACIGAHLAALARPRLRGRAFRLGVSIPGQAALAVGFLSGLWLLALAPIRLALGALELSGALAALQWLDAVPFAIAGVSLVTSTRPAMETVRIQLRDGGEPERVTRVPVERYRRGRAPAPTSRRPLRIVQISDPHLGPWQPVAKLRRHLEALIARDPDLVLLTGDFLTMEGGGTPGALAEALDPLRKVTGRAFAIFGNHDHEHPDEVRDALAACGVPLLVDDERVVETAAGSVQIVGADYVGRDRAPHIQSLLARLPRREGHLRILLLHDPLGFQYVPPGDVDLTLSGHTHGGQIGLVSLGLDWTVLTRSQWPDHGLFGRATNRLYVHRGTGFYGFPMRVGVPGEASLIEVVTDVGAG